MQACVHPGTQSNKKIRSEDEQIHSTEKNTWLKTMKTFVLLIT